MKNNKLFWPAVILAVIVLVEVVVFLSKTGSKSTVTTGEVATEQVDQVGQEEPVINFGWKEGEDMRTLTMTATKELVMDGMDLYVNFSGAENITVKEIGGQGNLIYSGIDKDNSRIVVKYYVKAMDGLKLIAGEAIDVLDINYQPIEGQKVTFSIDPSTLVVENGTVKTLPYL